MKTIFSRLFVFIILIAPIYAQQVINYGETLAASISVDGEVDIFTFTGIENEKIIIRLTENSGSYPMEPAVELFGPTGNVLTSVTNGAQAEIKIILPQSGTFTIFVSDVDGNDTGNYALFIQRMDNPGNSTVINYGETLSENFSSDGEVDSYSFSGTEGDKIILRLTENSNSYPLEPFVELFDPAGDSLTVDSDGAQAHIEYTLTADGSYTILASDFYPGDDTGTYALSIQRMVEPGDTTLIKYGETLTGDISTDGELDTYSFSGVEGDKIILRLTENSNSYPLEPFAELYDPEGDLVITDSDGAQAQIEFTLPLDGSYTILASDSYPGDDTGHYGIFIQKMINPGNATEINYGETLAGAISTDGELDTYTFSGHEGDNITLRLTENSNSYPLEPFVELYDVEGNLLISESDGAQAQIDISLPKDGTYTILTSDSYPGDDTGNYALFIQRLDKPGKKTKILFGETLAANFSTDGEVDTYTFLGGVRDSVIIRLTENSNSYPLEPYIELYDPSGDQLITASDGVQVETGFRLLKSGYYTILVSDSYPGDDTGNYSIFLFGFLASQIVAVPDSVNFGDVIVGQIGEKNFLLYNRATFDVSLHMSIEGDDPENFSIDQALTTLVSGDSQYVSLSFTPDVAESLNAVILISSDGGEATVNLKGIGIPEPTAIGNQSELMPFEFSLHQNYPNPFNPTTTIRYSLPLAEKVSIKVFDMLGREVSVLVNEYKNAGVHSIEFDGSRFSSGVYFYQIQAGEFNQVRKMLLVK